MGGYLGEEVPGGEGKEDMLMTTNWNDETDKYINCRRGDDVAIELLYQNSNNDLLSASS